MFIRQLFGHRRRNASIATINFHKDSTYAASNRNRNTVAFAPVVLIMTNTTTQPQRNTSTTAPDGPAVRQKNATK